MKQKYIRIFHQQWIQNIHIQNKIDILKNVYLSVVGTEYYDLVLICINFKC